MDLLTLLIGYPIIVFSIGSTIGTWIAVDQYRENQDFHLPRQPFGPMWRNAVLASMRFMAIYFGAGVVIYIFAAGVQAMSR